MLVLSIIVLLITLILVLYWFFAIRSYRKCDDIIGFIYGIPLTVIGIVIYSIIFSQFVNWRL